MQTKKKIPPKTKPNNQTKHHHQNEVYHNLLSLPKGTDSARRNTSVQWILLGWSPACKPSEPLLNKKQLN